MNTSERLRKLLEREMDRAGFLKMLLVALLAAVGISRLLSVLIDLDQRLRGPK